MLVETNYSSCRANYQKKSAHDISVLKRMITSIMHNIHSVVQVVLCDKLITSSPNSMHVRVQNYVSVRY